MLAEIYRQKKHYAQARVRWQHLLLVDPANCAAHYNLGVLSTLMQDWGEAQQQSLSALHTDPGSAEVHNTLGSIYLRRGRLELARGELEKGNPLAAGICLGALQPRARFQAAREAGRSCPGAACGAESRSAIPARARGALTNGSGHEAVGRGPA